MERTLTVTIKTNLKENTFDIGVLEPESGFTMEFEDVPFSPDEHPEFDGQIGNEIYSWIIDEFEAEREENAMKKMTKYFTNDYKNDTTIECVSTSLYSQLNCSFTSEDPDYGTDTLHYTANPATSMEQMAYEMLREVTNYLDYRDGSRLERPDVQIAYEDYSSSTLIAVEKALAEITKDYKPARYATIADASEWVAKELLADRTKKFAFCESDRKEATEDPKEHKENGGWHGIKRIDGFFDNEPEEFIVAVGHYGGGNVGFGYADFGSGTNDYARAIRGAICQATGWDTDNMIYIEEDKGE